MAINCLGSLLAQSAEPLSLVFHDDGSLSGDDRTRLQSELAHIEVLNGSESSERAFELLKSHPVCREFRATNVLSRKLFDTVLFHDDPEIAYCDTDILFLRRFTRLLEFPDRSVSSLFMLDWQESYALRPWDLTGRNAVKVPSRINTGLMLVRREVFDLDYLEWFLGLRLAAFMKFPLWLEQTAWAALAARHATHVWDPERVLVVRREIGLTANVVAAHFTSDVRDLLDSASANIANGDPVSVPAVPSKSLSALGLGCSQGARFLRRKWARR
jgi:hypothetical protein